MDIMLIAFLILLVYFIGVLFTLVLIAIINARLSRIGYHYYPKGVIGFSWFGVIVVIIIELVGITAKFLDKLYELIYKTFK